MSTDAQPSARATTADLMQRLQRHYIQRTDMPGGIFLPEVGWNATGGTSRADALYVGFTSASGRLLIGHEVKATRSDWLTELRKAGKADGWADNCHAWYLVTVPGVVADGELPEGWGLMHPAPQGRRMKVVTKARVHADRTPSWDATRSIMARLDTLQQGARQVIRDEERARLSEEVQAAAGAEERWRDHFARQADTMRERAQRINQALGRHVVDHDTGSLDTVGPKLLADLGSLLAHHADLQSAVDELAGRYSPPNIPELREAIDHLEAAIGRARAGLPPTTNGRY